MATAPTEATSIDASEATTKKTTTITQVDLGRRLVEYFCVVSSIEYDGTKKKHPEEIDWKTESVSAENDKYQFKPAISARYPQHDHPDNPLHDNVVYFCHPSGGIQLRTEPHMPKVRNR